MAATASNFISPADEDNFDGKVGVLWGVVLVG